MSDGTPSNHFVSKKARARRRARVRHTRLSHRVATSNLHASARGHSSLISKANRAKRINRIGIERGRAAGRFRRRVSRRERIAGGRRERPRWWGSGALRSNCRRIKGLSNRCPDDPGPRTNARDCHGKFKNCLIKLRYVSPAGARRSFTRAAVLRAPAPSSFLSRPPVGSFLDRR